MLLMKYKHKRTADKFTVSSFPQYHLVLPQEFFLRVTGIIYNNIINTKVISFRMYNDKFYLGNFKITWEIEFYPFLIRFCVINRENRRVITRAVIIKKPDQNEI